MKNDTYLNIPSIKLKIEVVLTRGCVILNAHIIAKIILKILEIQVYGHIYLPSLHLLTTCNK